jgi:hypothetical protein
MHLAALSTGSQAPRGRFNGAVHTVFRQACNIRLDDGRMLALLAPQLGNVPHGVRLDVPMAFAFADHVTVGQRVGCRADVLRIAGTLSIDLGTAQPWRGELPPARVDLSAPEVLQAWRAAWHTLWRGRISTGDSQPRVLASRVDTEGLRLARATRRFHTDEVARGLKSLIGCGPGLTPSGDDLIVGFLAGLWSTTADHPPRRAFLDRLCTAVAAAAAATGDISRAYLAHATHARFAEPLTTLARHIDDGAECGTIEHAAGAALRVGDTSGADGVFGLLLGLAAWAPPSVLSGLPRASDVVAWLEPAAHNFLPRHYRPAEAMHAPEPAGRRIWDPCNAMLAEC